MPPLEENRGVPQRTSRARPREALLTPLEGSLDGIAEVGGAPLERILERPPIRDHRLRRVRGRVRAMIRDVVDEGRVRLVADPADDGHAGREGRARHDLVVEAPQVLDRAASAADHDHVDPAAIEVLDRARDLSRGGLALDTAVGESHREPGPAERARPEEVAPSVRVAARDDAHHAREPRERTLAIEEPLVPQLGLQSFELRQQGAEPARLHPVDDQAVLAVGRIDVQRAVADDSRAVLQLQPSEGAWHLAPPDLGVESRAIVLEREEDVAGSDGLRPADLTLDGHPTEPLQGRVDPLGQPGHGFDPRALAGPRVRRRRRGCGASTAAGGAAAAGPPRGIVEEAHAGQVTPPPAPVRTIGPVQRATSGISDARQVGASAKGSRMR